MTTLDSTSITLSDPILSGLDERLIEVDLHDPLNPDVDHIYYLTNKFEYNAEAFTRVSIDKSRPERLIISMLNAIDFSTIETEVSITYYATSSSGDMAKGKITFSGQTFTMSAAPIYININRCCLPTRIVIDPMAYNSGTFVLHEVDEIHEEKGSATVIDSGSTEFIITSPDPSTQTKQIVYQLNLDYWKIMNVTDKIKYVITPGETDTVLSNYIYFTSVDCECD